MIEGPIPEALTFDDVLLLPGKSAVLPAQADTRTCLSRGIAINIPIVAEGPGTGAGWPARGTLLGARCRRPTHNPSRPQRRRCARGASARPRPAGAAPGGEPVPVPGAAATI